MKSIGVFCAVVAMCAQEPRPALLAGRVLDPAGAAIPGAQVQLKSATAITDSEGRYNVTVPPGKYDLSVSAEGFANFIREGLEVRAGETAIVNVTLAIGTLIAQVEVTAKAPAAEFMDETRTSNIREVLEIREVRESAARDVAEALTRLEGLWKIRKGGIANDIVLRGFQQENLNVLIDGVRIHGACPNNMDPPAFHVDFAEIEQVKITKGPFDIKDQGSLGGVVNIVSKPPSPGVRLTPGFSAGSFGYYNPSLVGSVSGENLSLVAGHSFRRSMPYRDGRGRRFTEYADYQERAKDRDAFGIHTGWLKLGAKAAGDHRFDLAYTRQAGGEVLYPYLLMDALYDNADRFNASYRFKQVRVQSYFTRVKHWMTDEFRTSAAGAPRPYGMASFASTKTMGTRVDAEWQALSAGFESYRRNWNGVNSMRQSGMYMDQPFLPDVNLTVAGIYAEYRRAWRRLRLTAGGRLDIAGARARSAALNTDLYWAYNGTRSRAAVDANPSGHLTAAITIPRGELFAGIGHAVRVPDPHERYISLRRMGSDWVGNPALRPTQNTEIDLGINYRARIFTLRPTVYFSRLEDYVTVHKQPRMHPVPGVMNTAARSFENVSARMYGGEMSYSVGLGPALLFSGGMSYPRGTKPYGDLAEMPPLKSRGSLRYGTRRFFAEAEAHAVRAQRRVDTELREQSTPGYAIFNLRGGIHWGKLNLAAGIDNLADRYYYEHFSFQRDPFRTGSRVPEPGRSVYLTASYGF